MRVAALYDIHGNLSALEAVLHEVRQAKVDQIVVGGDVVPGPMPRESFECLVNLDVPIQFIRGNCERDVLELLSGNTVNVHETFQESFRWVAQQLQPEFTQLAAAWPLTTEV